MPIAVPDFVGGGPGNAQAGANVAGVVRADLERSGLFRPLDPQGLCRTHHQHQHRARLRQLARGHRPGPGHRPGRPSNPTGACAWISACGTFTAKARCWALQFFTTPENWRRIAHMVSDAMYERITGEKGYFDTRIVFISESGPSTIRRVKRLAIMDEDGANPDLPDPRQTTWC